MTGPPIARGSKANGVKTFGPSGVGVWARPTLDAARNLLYIATGDNYSYPSTETSDAVLALDRKTGRIVWSKQLTANDVYNSSCVPNPERCGPDFDFGSSPILSGPTRVANCCWRVRSLVWCGRSILPTEERSCGKREWALAAPTAACNGAWPPMASRFLRRSPISNGRPTAGISTRDSSPIQRPEAA